MGQMTYAVLYGVPFPKMPKGKRWWGDSVEKGGEWVYEKGLEDIYKAPRGRRLRNDEGCNVLGFSVAVGASGEDGVPYLEGPISLAEFATTRRYAKAIEKAKAAWAHLATFLAEHGVKHEAPTLWLVEIEVA